jgi:exonuclease III
VTSTNVRSIEGAGKRADIKEWINYNESVLKEQGPRDVLMFQETKMKTGLDWEPTAKIF